MPDNCVKVLTALGMQSNKNKLPGKLAVEVNLIRQDAVLQYGIITGTLVECGPCMAVVLHGSIITVWPWLLHVGQVIP